MRNSSVSYIYETLRRFPDRPCVADENRTLSVRDFFREAYAVAQQLVRRGGAFNRPVLIYLPKSAEAIVSFAASLLSGNFYVPLDIKSPQERNDKIVRDLRPQAVISLKRYQDQLRGLSIDRGITIFLDDMAVEDSLPTDEEMISACRLRTDNIVDIDPCYVMYTSGSTGLPKGVIIPHRGVIDYIDWAVSFLKTGPEDIIGNQAPTHFDNSTLDIYMSWATGAELRLIPESLFSFPVKLIEHLEEMKVSFVFFVPSVLTQVSRLRVLSPGRLPSLKTVVFAGEVMPPKHLAYWQTILPEKRYINLYGPTEITVDCTGFVVDRIYADNESIPIGTPRSNMGVIILNDRGELAAVGEAGELCVRGSSLALGYWNDMPKTAQAFVPNPLQGNYPERIYRTGDIAYESADHQLIFVGRKDTQIKHMGYRIELGEVERAAESLPDVAKGCVLYNHEAQEITLFYESEREIGTVCLRRALALLLPAYMVPRTFHHLAKLPLNSNGKVDRRALADALR